MKTELLATIAVALLLIGQTGCTAIRTYRIWTADDPSDGYAIGTAREIPPPYRTLEAGDFPIEIPTEHRPKP